MALSGKTTNFELKYPKPIDTLQINSGSNNFKEMMDSVDAALDKAIEYDTIITTQEEWDAMAASPTWNNAKKVLINSDSIIYIDNNTPDGDQYSMTVPSNVVEIYVAKNGLGNKNNHSEALHSNCSIIYEPGCTKFVNNPQNGYMIKNAQCDPENFHYIVNCTGYQLVEGHIAIGCEYETYTNIKYILDCNITSSTEINDCGFIENTGRLSELTTTAKTDLVSAINELKTNISDSGIIDLGLVEGDLMEDMGGIASSFLDVTTAGFYKFSIKNNGNETVDGCLIVSNNQDVAEVNQILITTGSMMCRFLPDPDTSSFSTPVEWVHFATADQIPTINGSTIPTVSLPESQTTDIDSIKVYINGGIEGDVNNSATKIYPTNIDSVVKIIFNTNVPNFSIYHDLSYTLFQNMFHDENVGAGKGHIYQILLDNNGNKYTRQVNYNQEDGGLNALTYGDWNEIVDKNTKSSSIVIGNSTFGLTDNDVDYLYTIGTDFSTVLSSAISKLTIESGAKGGEIKILSGTYTLTSPVTVSGTVSAPIKITGEGKSTIITSNTPTDSYINASYCEISECKLYTDITITSIGYVNIHDCEISERIYINNPSTIYHIFIHNNNIARTSGGKDFIYLSGAGDINSFQVYDNYDDGTLQFNFLHAAATKNLRSSSIKNNHCPYGVWNSTGYSLNGNTSGPHMHTMTGNTFWSIDFSGHYWCISNNHITHALYLHNGYFLDFINNRIRGTFTVASGLTYANITGNVIDAVATTSPYVNLGTNARFVNNVIRNTNFSTTYIPGYNIASNMWGNNMWKNGFDRMIFANGEGIGEGQGDA